MLNPNNYKYIFVTFTEDYPGWPQGGHLAIHNFAPLTPSGFKGSRRAAVHTKYTSKMVANPKCAYVHVVGAEPWMVNQLSVEAEV